MPKISTQTVGNIVKCPPSHAMAQHTKIEYIYKSCLNEKIDREIVNYSIKSTKQTLLKPYLSCMLLQNILVAPLHIIDMDPIIVIWLSFMTFAFNATCLKTETRQDPKNIPLNKIQPKWKNLFVLNASFKVSCSLFSLMSSDPLIFS